MSRVLVGCYDAGVTALVREGGRWEVGPQVLAAQNASFLVRSSRGTICAVDERAHRVSGWTAAGERLFDVASGGADPCYLALSPDERWLAVANYADGSVALLPLDSEGQARDAIGIFRGDGTGPDPERQTGPHAHWVGFADGGQTLLSTDLGADCVRAFTVDPERGLVDDRVAYRAPPGSGPRHLLMIGEALYLVSELDASLTVLTRADDTLLARERHRLSSEAALGGAMRYDPAHRLLHVTARGDDRVVSFRVADDGRLTLRRQVASGGASPRDLLIDGRTLFVAHEESGEVAVFPLDADGLPGLPSQVIAVPGAAFLMQADA